MQSCAEDFVSILEAESSLGLTYATNLFIERQPDSPNNCVCIFNTSGYPPELTLGNDTTLYYPAVQIVVRNTASLVAYDLAFNIMTSLHGRGPEVWNETSYLSIKCDREPFLLQWDEKMRVYYSLNFSILRR